MRRPDPPRACPPPHRPTTRRVRRSSGRIEGIVLVVLGGLVGSLGMFLAARGQDGGFVIAAMALTVVGAGGRAAERAGPVVVPRRRPRLAT